MRPNPKSRKRIVDPSAIRRAVLTYPWCAACGERGSNGHHVVQKGSPHFGDDVVANVVALCGTGTMRCHGAIHGSPYVVAGERRDQAWVARRIGETLVRERPDVIVYVLDRLGQEPGRAWLERSYFVFVGG